jgi:diguanylate cyclase (GGDEF)-like protein
MSQLLALRERDPAPMVLIVLRVEGLAGTAARLGIEAGNILRRKVAVRLRGGLRASDVVAATGPDSFGILLGHIEAPSDGERVAAKLVQVLKQPFQVAGQSCTVAVAVGVAHYPEHGTDATALLQRAAAQAASAAVMGQEGFAVHAERAPAAAANDESSGA